MNCSKRKGVVLKEVLLKIVLGSIFPLLILMQKALQTLVHIINHHHHEKKKEKRERESWDF